MKIRQGTTLVFPSFSGFWEFTTGIDSSILIVWGLFNPDYYVKVGLYQNGFLAIPEGEKIRTSCLSCYRPAMLSKFAWHKALLRFDALYGSKNLIQNPTVFC